MKWIQLLEIFKIEFWNKLQTRKYIGFPLDYLEGFKPENINKKYMAEKHVFPVFFFYSIKLF